MILLHLISNLYFEIQQLGPTGLLVVAKEHLDRQPPIPAHLEALLDPIQRLHIISRQLPAVQLEIRLNTRLRHGLGQHREALGQSPGQQDLLRRLAFGLGDGQERVVLGERRVGAAERRVGGRVDVLGGEVGDELGRGVARVQLDLVDSWNDLGGAQVVLAWESRG